MRKRLTENSKIHKGASRLPFLFAKFLTIVCYLTLQFSAFGQGICQIRLHATSTPARCQADGAIQCSISDTAGLSLEQIRFTYTPLSGIDSIVETTLSRIDHLRPGDYRVTVSALCRTGLGYEDAYCIVADTIDRVVVSSLYHIPTSNAQTNLYSKQYPYGTIPSLTCAPTGRLQLLIQHGTFPYTVDLWKISSSDTTFLRTITFDTLQNHGSNPLRDDYLHYYSIDSLEAGNYQLLCHDGCGYYMPLLFAEVPNASLHTDILQFLLRNSSCIPRSNNIIVFKETLRGDMLLNNPSYYYYNSEQPSFEYRFINPTLSNTLDTTSWRPLPNVTSSTSTYIIDTLSALSSYGEVWMKEITLQYRAKYCPDTIWSSTFTIYPQGSNYHREFTHFHQQTFIPNWFDYCYYHYVTQGGVNETSELRFFHSMDETLVNVSDSLNQNNYRFYTTAGGIPSTMIGTRYHSYITLPLRYRIIDSTTSEVVLTDTLNSLKYNWAFLYQKDKNRNGHTLCIEITDYLESPLYSTVFISNIDTTIIDTSSSRTRYGWLTDSKSENQCSESLRSIYLYIIASEYALDGDRYAYSGDTLRLIESPESNRYNLTAYSDTCAHYIVQRERLDNLADIGYYRKQQYNTNIYRPSLRLQAPNLPSGRYVWVVSHACDRPNDTIIQTVRFPETPNIVTAPAYRFIQECSRLKIVPVAGQYAIDGVNTRTFFQAHLGDTLAHSLSSVQLGDTICLGVPGTYTLSMYALPLNNASLLESNPCYITDTVISWDARTIEYDYIISYVCDEHDSTGFVRARGKYGLLPHTYTLYDAPDGTGNILGQNNIGDFNGLPIHYGQRLSIDMRDNCNAHFLTNFTVSDMEHIRKAWMEDNVRETTLYEGDTCHLFSISMGEVTYRWSGPGGFVEETQNPFFRIPDSAQATGSFFVTIDGSGCTSLQDSVHLMVAQAPTIRIARDTTVCPGAEIEVITSISNPTPISYTLIKEAFGIQERYRFERSANGQHDTLRTTITDDNTLFYISDIADSLRVYHIASDTVHAYLIGDYRSIAISSTDASVCRGSDVTLTAVSTSLPPYIIQWRDLSDSLLLQTDTITTAGTVSHLTVNNAHRNMVFQISAMAENGCPTHNGFFQDVKMSTQTVTLANNRGIRFHDSGGAESGYLPTENSIITFQRADSTATLSLRFEQFNCSDSAGVENSDVLYIFDGPTNTGVPTHTLRGRLTGSALPTIVSSSGALTCWFIANHVPTTAAGAYEGWSATLVSTHLDSISLEASTTSTLTIKGAPSDTTYQLEIMEEELPYDWDGHLFTSADTLVEHLYTLTGCDSIVTRVLTVKSLPACPPATDYDGNVYPSIRIGRYCWTQANLLSQHYSDGRVIATAMGYYADTHPDTLRNIETFGRLYDWYAAIDTATHVLSPSGHTQGICPEGWYLPTIEQYEELNEHGESALRSPEYWLIGGGNNITGFTSLPGGFYCGERQRFENLLGEAHYWADSRGEFSEISLHVFENMHCSILKKQHSNKENGYSIRCIYDE